MDVVMPELQTSSAIMVIPTNLGGDLPDSDEPPLKSINAKYMCPIIIIFIISSHQRFQQYAFNRKHRSYYLVKTPIYKC